MVVASSIVITKDPERLSMRHLLARLALLVFPGLAFAHGDNEPGPHGGLVTMPGIFHVEVTRDGAAFNIYLLDMNIQRPTVHNSSISASVESGALTTELDCQSVPEQHHFRCSASGDQRLDNGLLVVTATRDGSPPASARYHLPLEAPAD
jgi:hypothetical protein